jgi:hypothetical protein
MSSPSPGNPTQTPYPTAPKPSTTLPGKVAKIIPSLSTDEASTVQISVDAPPAVYREVRIENTLTNESEGKVSLKAGSPVEITVTAGAGSTTVQCQLPFSQKTVAVPLVRGNFTLRIGTRFAGYP